MAESVRFVRFVASPRALANGIVGDMAGWTVMGLRMLERSRNHCPVGAWENGPDPRGHLKDALELRFVTGPDPRILVGSTKKGDVLRYLIEGTDDHWVRPVNKRALSWVSGGVRYFSRGHKVRGIKANNFVLRAMREVVLTTGNFG